MTDSKWGGGSYHLSSAFLGSLVLPGKELASQQKHCPPFTPALYICMYQYFLLFHLSLSQWWCGPPSAKLSSSTSMFQVPSPLATNASGSSRHYTHMSFPIIFTLYPEALLTAKFTLSKTTTLWNLQHIQGKLYMASVSFRPHLPKYAKKSFHGVCVWWGCGRCIAFQLSWLKGWDSFRWNLRTVKSPTESIPSLEATGLGCCLVYRQASQQPASWHKVLRAS
jgi:hypothetical protein